MRYLVPMVFLVDQGSDCLGNEATAARVAFWIHDRGDYVLWKYTNWVQCCLKGAGNREFLKVLSQVRAAFPAVP